MHNKSDFTILREITLLFECGSENGHVNSLIPFNNSFMSIADSLNLSTMPLNRLTSVSISDSAISDTFIITASSSEKLSG